MRIVVTGLSGNVGTSLLRALTSRQDVEVVGICRRPPPPVPPYDRAAWTSVDLSRPDARARLAGPLRGADAVVHLAWAIQPVRREAAMAAVNVGGSTAVREAVLDAGIGHLVQASSSGTYAPRVEGTGPVDESWPATGIATSAYSRQKARVEADLDRFAAAHPQVLVSRLRPTLIAQADAAREVAQLFLGPLVPPPVVALFRRAARRTGHVLLPRGLRLQLVHADDVAAALVAVLDRKAAGPFNLAADTLDTAGMAAVLGARPVHVPPRLVRAAAGVLFAVHAVPVSPGWTDLALATPDLDTTRARELLGWRPRHDSTAIARELLDAAASPGRADSPALARPAQV